MRRALVAAAAGVALLTGACGGSDTVDRVGSEGAATGSPSPREEVVCFGGSYEPAEEGTVVPRDEACPEDEPSPSTAPGPEWEPSAAFLPPEAAAQAESPGWSVSADHAAEPGPLLDPCGEGRFPRADEVVASDERAMGSTREAGGSGLAQEVFRYSSPEAAADALRAYADAVVRCPEQQAPQSPEGYTNRFTVVEQAESGGIRRLLVRRQPCSDADQCAAHFRTYLLAAQAGDGVTVADYGIGEDGDPEDDARALQAAAARQLADAVQAP